MTERRIDTWYGRRLMLVNALFVVPGLVALLLAIGRARFDAWSFAWVGVFLACLAAGIAIAVRRRRRGYCCPQCGQSIPAPLRRPTHPGDPYDYYCPQCDVLWYTQLHVSGGD